MSRLEITNKINTVLADYFNTHKGETVKAKEMMDSPGVLHAQGLLR